MGSLVASPSSGIGPSEVAAVIDSMDLSESSRAQYSREIRVFTRWLGGSAISPATLTGFKRYLRDRTDIGAGSRAKYLAIARAFLKTLFRLGAIPVDVTAGVRGFKATRAHKRLPITDDDIGRVFSYLDSGDADPRAKVIVGLMYYQGLRRIEVQRLRVEDFDSEALTLAILGKGRDDRETVDLHPLMVAILAKYLRETGLKSGPLFPSREKAASGLSSSMLWRIVAEGVHREIGLNRNLHGYRKAFTTRLIKSGMPLLDVMSYTRHSSVEMLSIYYHRLEKTKTLPTYYAALQ